MILNRSVRSQYSDSSLAHPASSFASRVPSSSRRPSSPPPAGARISKKSQTVSGLRSLVGRGESALDVYPPQWGIGESALADRPDRPPGVQKRSSARRRHRRARAATEPTIATRRSTTRRSRGRFAARDAARARDDATRGENDGGVVRCLRRVRVDARRARRGPRAVHEPRAAEDGGG